MFSLIKKLFNIYPQVSIRKNTRLKKHVIYLIDLTSLLDVQEITRKIGIKYSADSVDKPFEFGKLSNHIKNRDCCKKAYIRGAFLAVGSISDPEKAYHLEITIHDRFLAEELKELVNGFGLNSKIILRKSSHIVYIKEGEDIVDFLNIIKAHSALLELENIRILKDMRNNVNRAVNCETANLQKTVDASIRQVENIKYIIENAGIESLPEPLREIAEKRLLHSEASLKELGEMIIPALGKSGVNHRLRKLDKIADEIRRNKGVQS